MESLLNMGGWFGKSITGMICIIPLMLMFNFFGKNYSMKPDLVMFCWTTGVIIGYILLAYKSDIFTLNDIQKSFVPAMCIIVIALFVGATANIMIARATQIAPNPALPFVIVSIGSGLAYCLTAILGRWVPKYFNPVDFSWVNFSGILLMAIGMGLVMYKNS